MAEMFDFEVEKRNRITIPNNSVFSLSIENEKNDLYNSSKENMEGDINMTREELDAKLAQNKAEVQAIASGMREEMAHWREEQNAQMGKIITTLSVLDVKLDERYENQKTASTRTQWMIGIAIAVAAIIPAVIALLK
ncbi:hypothetical protein [Providencia stuartii]|uniref:hypothetical protein n=1 Tax=Providencia stuartii TaxID=588 RepID=UPI0034E40D65